MERKHINVDFFYMAFTVEGDIVRYMAIHKGENPYPCSDYMAFSIKRYLNAHTKVHNRDKPHKCSYCDQVFSTNCGLARHLKRHTCEKPYNAVIVIRVSL